MNWKEDFDYNEFVQFMNSLSMVNYDTHDQVMAEIDSQDDLEYLVDPEPGYRSVTELLEDLKQN